MYKKSSSYFLHLVTTHNLNVLLGTIMKLIKMQTSGGHWDWDRSGRGDQGKTSNTFYAQENLQVFPFLMFWLSHNFNSWDVRTAYQRTFQRWVFGQQVLWPWPWLLEPLPREKMTKETPRKTLGPLSPVPPGLQVSDSPQTSNRRRNLLIIFIVPPFKTATVCPPHIQQCTILITSHHPLGVM